MKPHIATYYEVSTTYHERNKNIYIVDTIYGKPFDTVVS